MPHLTDRAIAPKPTLPGLTTTVPREYVHRAAVSEVLLTSWEQAGPDGFAVRAQWPRSHALFAPDAGYQDPMLLIESVRQIGSLLAHAEFDVPFGHQFLMSDMSVTAEPDLLVTDVVPTDVEMHTVCRDVVRRAGRLREMRYDVTVVRENGARATASAAFRCMSPEVYRRMRGERPTTTDRTPPPALDPAAVGHAGTRHVVLCEPAPGAYDRWELRVDTAHPTYFDHPVDHIPGMFLLEAARQAAHARTGAPCALLLGMRSEFVRYAELDAPCWITAAPEPYGSTGDLLVRVCGSQRQETVFTAELVLRPRVR
ncbi:ScbA/BarX family gamma-butyrolactone biosynthesis protein [Streptomyces sp. GbtcB6]|uniref:ScbA/BarX family gamma-butyrolactone biosynthesis protein n=1 Tax=Streptomyces sp. GbtcB6 TaxID=2824751 RepID=UPI001C2FFC73|nr:ScbA/BarX family gamma-butyrolactone biosynthesis protein [Streptomyces sp. GbtcB6]